MRSFYMLYGNWVAGAAISLYTIRYPGYPEVYTKLGKMLYELKYNNSISTLDYIAQVIASFVKRLKVYKELDAIVPVPPSKLNREFQPVTELAKRVSNYTGVPTELGYLVKVKETPEMKRIKDPLKKMTILRDSYRILTNSLEGKTVLLFDDLYKSGATLKACTDTLLSEGKVGRVYVLTLVKTWPCSNFEIKKGHCERCRRILERCQKLQK
uniref:ComF family protein n=1 Tax=Fervidobacterium thailandense TaxID=1008305 RepID=A0A7C4GL64_9BACT